MNVFIHTVGIDLTIPLFEIVAELREILIDAIDLLSPGGGK